MFDSIISRMYKSKREEQLEKDVEHLSNLVQTYRSHERPERISWKRLELDKQYRKDFTQALVQRIISECFLNRDFPIYDTHVLDDIINQLMYVYKNTKAMPILDLAVDEDMQTVHAASIQFPAHSIRMAIF